MTLHRFGPGETALRWTVNDRVVATIPFDNLVKMNVRLDPDHASEAQRQVAHAREEMAKARASAIDWEAKAKSLTTQLRDLRYQYDLATNTTRAFSDSFIQPPACAGGCSRGGEGPPCGLSGCRG